MIKRSGLLSFPLVPIICLSSVNWTVSFPPGGKSVSRGRERKFLVRISSSYSEDGGVVSVVRKNDIHEVNVES